MTLRILRYYMSCIMCQTIQNTIENLKKKFNILLYFFVFIKNFNLHDLFQEIKKMAVVAAVLLFEQKYRMRISRHKLRDTMDPFAILLLC